MTDKEFAYWDKMVTGLGVICKKKHLTVRQYLDIIDSNKIKKFKSTKVKVPKYEAPKVWVNHKFSWVKEMTEEEFNNEVELGFELNLLHND